MHFENPYSCEEVSEAIIQALAMPLQERQRRWRQLNDTVCSQDAAWWRKMFINFLSETPAAPPIRSWPGGAEKACCSFHCHGAVDAGKVPTKFSRKGVFGKSLPRHPNRRLHKGSV